MIWSSVVPLPIPPANDRKTVDLPFSKHGVIFARPTSPSAKCVYPFLISPQGLTSCPFGTPYSDEIKGIGTKETLLESETMFLGLREPMHASCVQAQVIGMPNGGSSGSGIFFEALISGSKLEDRLNTSQNDTQQFDEGRTIRKGDLIPASNAFKAVKISEFTLPNECIRNL